MPADRRRARAGDLVFTKVREVLAAGGCPVCRLVAHAVHRFLDNFLYERVNDPHTRDAVRAAWGFCRAHAWALSAQRNPVLGLAMVYQDLVRALRHRLEAALHRADPRRALEEGLRASGRCPACEHEARMEEVYLSALVDHLEDPEVSGALSGRAPLCLPHLRRAVSLVSSRHSLRQLLTSHQQALAHLEADLSEVVRKHDYRFRHEGFTPEQATSWLRAVEVFSGGDPDELRAPYEARHRSGRRRPPKE